MKVGYLIVSLAYFHLVEYLQIVVPTGLKLDALTGTIVVVPYICSLDTLATTQSKRKKPSERSEIWDHFTKYDPERVFTITVDNASSNELAINYVKKKLKNWSENGLVLDGDFLHMRCCAHILNLIVNEGLKDLHVSISRIRNAVKYVKSSPARLKKFKICVEHERIEGAGLVVQDVSTRWNSTYLMLESALKFQKAFERMEDDDQHYVSYFKEDGGPPNSDDWENANVFVLFLKSFYDITLKFSGSMYVTSNLYFHEMCSIHSDLTSLIESSDDLVLSKMATSMKNKYDKYWGSIDRLNNLLLISVILDPRYKLKYVTFCFEDIFVIDEVGKKSEKVKNLLIRLYEYYKDLDTKIGGCGSSSDVGKSSIVDSRKFDKKVGFSKLSSVAKFKQRIGKYDCVEMKNEVERYLLEPCEHVDDDDFEILAWWKMNSIKYRVLSHIAKDVFAIPISTVASESAFSTGGRIIDSFRSSLSPKMVEALICSQNWLLHTFVPLQDEPTMEELEFYEAIMSDYVFITATIRRNLPKSDVCYVKWIFRYLDGTIDVGLLLKKDCSQQCVGYCDSDFAGDLDKRRSTTGYVFTLNGDPISWRSILQLTIALSTAEAEYMTATEAVKEAIWLKGLLGDLGVIQQNIAVFYDNQNAIFLTKNQTYHALTKHIDVKYHYV
ncbi:BED-type domain-containing protein [Citrus sinensis]|nr:BED-type domain-containing protein [Citrus sinensis]